LGLNCGQFPPILLAPLLGTHPSGSLSINYVVFLAIETIIVVVVIVVVVIVVIVVVVIVVDVGRVVSTD